MLTYQRIDRRTDKASYRVACPQLKMITMSKGRPCFLQVVSVLYWIVKVSSHCMDGLTKKEILTMSKGRTLFRWSNWVSCSIYSIIFPSHSYDSQMRSCCSIFHEVPTSELRSFFMNIVLTVGTTLILRLRSHRTRGWIFRHPDTWFRAWIALMIAWIERS